jgi:aminoglycoside phosphotransferase (APT) family kinase protein
VPDTWTADNVRTLGLSLVDGAAAVGRVDHVAVGLGDLGRPDGFLERQVGRWKRHLAGYLEVPEYGPLPRIDGVDDVGRWLDGHRPTTWTPGLIHGDLHLANCMTGRTDPHVLALVDWEMSTVGDPLLDLGWLLATWPGADEQNLVGSVALRGLPSAAEVVERYAAGSVRDLTHVRWYEVLACYKLGIVLEGTYVRALAGRAPMAVGEQLHATTERLFARAQERIG